MSEQTTDITPELLIADGWKKTEGEEPRVVLFEKAIENRNPLNNDPDDTDIKLIIHGYYNVWRFAIAFPDGGMLNFIANSMAELKAFENAIDFYDCPY